VALKTPPDASNAMLRKRVLLKVATTGLNKCEPQILSCINGMGLDPKHSEAIKGFLAGAMARIPVILEKMDDIEMIVERLQNGILLLIYF